ncbi:hypothetical protein GE21DRAFT_1043132 [Neurospora crassa]|nr:hypothetical protein GE21DRAFT_1043132 [Neurospora crassa]
MYSLVPTESNCASSAYVHVSVAFHKGTVAGPGVDVRAGERKAMLTMHGRHYTCTTKPFSLLVALLVAKRLDMPSGAHVGSAKRTDTHPRHHSTIPMHYWLPCTRAAKGGQALLLDKNIHYQRVGFFRPLTECVSHSLHEGPPRANSELSFFTAPCTPYASSVPLRQDGEGKQPVAEISEKRVRIVIGEISYPSPGTAVMPP